MYMTYICSRGFSTSVHIHLPCGMEFVDVILDHKALTDREGASLKTFNERVTGYETSDSRDTKLSGMRTG